MPALPCQTSDDCQDNSGCFADELSIITTGEFSTLCHCNLGYVLDNSTAMFPMTGDCIDYHQLKCASTLAESNAAGSEQFCFEDDNEWGVCPYCRAFKHHEDHGGILELGYYVSGDGDFNTGDPMVFTGGSSTNCINPRSSEGYWYCWYEPTPRLCPSTTSSLCGLRSPCVTTQSTSTHPWPATGQNLSTKILPGRLKSTE